MSVWRGTAELTFGKAHVETTAGKLVVTTEVTGPYALCLAEQPAIGQTIAGFDAALRVTASKVNELDGDAARIDITLEAGLDDSDQDPEPLGEPTYEIEFGEIEKAIESHPRCGQLKDDRPKYKDGVVSGDGKQRTWEDWPSLDADDYDADIEPLFGSEETWTLDEYKSLKEKGVDSYPLAAPIIRRTTIHLRKPDDLGDGVGNRQTPPSAANFARISDYDWLGGPDRCTKSKRTYTRTTEWIGAEVLSALIYPEP